MTAKNHVTEYAHQIARDAIQCFPPTSMVVVNWRSVKFGAKVNNSWEEMDSGLFLSWWEGQHGQWVKLLGSMTVERIALMVM